MNNNRTLPFSMLDDEISNSTIHKLVNSEASIFDKEFTDVVFRDCDFSHSDFEGCLFVNCQFYNCDLSLIKIKHVEFNDVKFNDCKVAGIDWSMASWKFQFGRKRRQFPIAFKSCILNYSFFSKLDMYQVVFDNCVMHSVQFEHCDLERAQFINTDLTNAVFLNTSIKNSDFTSAHHYLIDPKNNNTKGAKFSMSEALGLLYAMDIILEE